jgi:rubrerythrin
VEKQHEIDDAIDIAIDRTKDAQGRFAEEMESAGVPDPGSAGVVVRRAEDLEVLAHDRKTPATDRPGPEASEPGPRSS